MRSAAMRARVVFPLKSPPSRALFCTSSTLSPLPPIRVPQARFLSHFFQLRKPLPSSGASIFCLRHETSQKFPFIGPGMNRENQTVSVFFSKVQKREITTIKRRRIKIKKYHYIKAFKCGRGRKVIPQSSRPLGRQVKKRALPREYLRSPRLKMIKHQR